MKLSAIASRSLSALANSHQHNHFRLSPISPKGFSSDSVPLRTSLLERYMIEGTHPTPNRRDRKFTLASSEVSNALPTPTTSKSLWSPIENGNFPIEAQKSTWTKPLSTPYPFDKAKPRKSEAMIDHKTHEHQDDASIPVLMYHNLHATTRPYFTMDDSGLQTPPPSSMAKTFARQIPEAYPQSRPSPFDLPTAPSFECSPADFSSSPESYGPAPVDTSLHDSRGLDLDSAMNCPVIPELATPPNPISEDSQKELHDKHVRHDSLTSITTRVDKQTKPKMPTVLASIAKDTPKRLPCPLPIPLKKNVRFAELHSPAHSQLWSPGVHGRFVQVSSPAMRLPTTPRAMFCTVPIVAGASQTISQADPLEESEEGCIIFPPNKKTEEQTLPVRGRPSNQQSGSEQPRSRSLSPPQSSTPLLPKVEYLDSLPATVYDPTVVYDATTNTRTMVYPAVPMVFDTKSYTARDITDNDRNRILQSYFNRARCGA